MIATDFWTFRFEQKKKKIKKIRVSLSERNSRAFGLPFCFDGALHDPFGVVDNGVYQVYGRFSDQIQIVFAQCPRRLVQLPRKCADFDRADRKRIVFPQNDRVVGTRSAQPVGVHKARGVRRVRVLEMVNRNNFNAYTRPLSVYAARVFFVETFDKLYANKKCHEINGVTGSGESR